MKGCGKITHCHGIPMPKCGEYPEDKNFIYLCEECSKTDGDKKNE